MASKINHWSPTRLARQDGKTFVITGANSGIGFQAAKLLAGAGGRILMLCRNPARATAAADALKTAASGSGKVETLQLDLSDMASIRACAEAVTATAPRIDALINNAGVMMPPKRATTVDGFEMQFGVNHLGHFLLAGLLADNVEAANGRVVAVSSTMHKAGLQRIRFEGPHWENGYNAANAYAQSKLANALFIRELNRRARDAGKPERGFICHPGYAATELQTKETKGVVKSIMAFGNALMAQSSERGSWPTVLCASDTEAQPGKYYGPVAFFEMRGPVGECKLASQARDDEAATKLWALSEQATGHSWTD